MKSADVERLIEGLLRDVPDYPSPGILFKDITPLLADARAFAVVVDSLVEHHAPGTIDKVVGIEARGFILAAPVAYHLGAGFVPMRKKGKLPYETFETSYELEYGSATTSSGGSIATSGGSPAASGRELNGVAPSASP